MEFNKNNHKLSIGAVRHMGNSTICDIRSNGKQLRFTEKNIHIPRGLEFSVRFFSGAHMRSVDVEQLGGYKELRISILKETKKVKCELYPGKESVEDVEVDTLAESHDERCKYFNPRYYRLGTNGQTKKAPEEGHHSSRH